jgi:hypothetical protein
MYIMTRLGFALLFNDRVKQSKNAPPNDETAVDTRAG